MTEYSLEWFEANLKKAKIKNLIFAIAAIILILASPFFLIKCYPTIGLNENNAHRVESKMVELELLTDEQSNSQYYIFKAEDGNSYCIDWKCYKEIHPFISVNGYEGYKFSFMTDRENNVIQMEVEGRSDPLLDFTTGYDRMNSENLIDAFPGVLLLALSVYCIIMSVESRKKFNKLTKEKEESFPAETAE